jgi:hypothetical protein
MTSINYENKKQFEFEICRYCGMSAESQNCEVRADSRC